MGLENNYKCLICHDHLPRNLAIILSEPLQVPSYATPMENYVTITGSADRENKQPLLKMNPLKFEIAFNSSTFKDVLIQAKTSGLNESRSRT